ncbi:4Fe-4S binding protein [Streptomyces halstedii]|uniref:4Fe-4S binding protein n=1 Tax=Streptomyces halstedii TaxID=1944 RepID=UPI00368CA95B
MSSRTPVNRPAAPRGTARLFARWPPDSTNRQYRAAMAVKITEDCINCGACEPECPNEAIQ